MHKKPFSFKRHTLLICLLAPLLLSGCGVIAVADAAVAVVATGVKITAKTVGAVADLVIPDDDNNEDE